MSIQECYTLHSRCFSALVHKSIEDILEALNSQEADAPDGMLLDSYTASYYQALGKLESLITVTKFELHMDIGVLLSKELSLECLEKFRAEIWMLVKTFTASYKVSDLP